VNGILNVQGMELRLVFHISRKTPDLREWMKRAFKEIEK
jgi:hypothetical protein